MDQWRSALKMVSGSQSIDLLSSSRNKCNPLHIYNKLPQQLYDNRVAKDTKNGAMI